MSDFELHLDDEFAPEGPKGAPLKAQAEREQSGWSLPAALCDDELIRELQAIPDKMGFKIGDVAELLGVKQYVLRYWETEFEILRPKKAANNQRYYTRKDVENAFLVKKLLYRDRFSIEGARGALKDLRLHVKREKDWTQMQTRVASLHDEIAHLRSDIQRMRQLFL